MNNYQELAIRTAKDGGFKFNLTHAVFGLTCEVGEFADCIKKYLIYGQSLDRDNAAEELGDIMWFVALVCETLDLKMDDIAMANIDKLKARYPDKYSDELAETRLDKA